MKQSRLWSLVGTVGLGASMLLTACGADPTATVVPATVAPTAAAAATTVPTAAGAATVAPTTAGAATVAPTAAGAATVAPTVAAGGDTTPVAPTPVPISTAKPGTKTLRINIGSDPDQVDPQKGSFVG